MYSNNKENKTTLKGFKEAARVETEIKENYTPLTGEGEYRKFVDTYLIRNEEHEMLFVITKS